MNLVQASHQAINGLDGLPSGSVGAALPSPPTEKYVLFPSHPPYIQLTCSSNSAVSRLNAWAQTMPGGSNCLSYDFKERPGVSVLGKAMSEQKLPLDNCITPLFCPDELIQPLGSEAA